MALTTAVQASLRRQRGALDARLATSTAAPAALRTALAEAVDLAAVVVDDGTGPEATDALVHALLEQVCAAAGREHGPERTALRRLAAPLAPWLRAEPGAVARVVHAARVLDRDPGALTAWCDRLAAAAPGTTDPGRLRALGVLAAWRSGLVRLRAAAHGAAAGLDPAALSAALGVDDPVAALAANAADPWAWPGHGPRPGELRVVARAGGFTGFGGPFPVPPVVLGGDGARWRVRAGAGEVLLLWDVHGQAVLPAEPGLPAASAPVATGGRLHLAGLSAPAPWTDVVTGSVAVGRTAVLSRAGSHLLDLVRAG